MWLFFLKKSLSSSVISISPFIKLIGNFGSSLDIIPTLKKQNCIFIDAPWTGRDYKKNISMQLFLDNIEISEIFKMFKKYTDLFIFKVPINYDFNYFIQNTKIIKYYIHAYSNIYKVIKFYYIFAPI